MVLIIVMLPHFYINTVIFSCIINIVSMVYDQVRTKKLGFAVRNEKFFDSLNNLMVFSVFFPIFNIISSIMIFVNHNFLYKSIQYIEKKQIFGVYIATYHKRIMMYNINEQKMEDITYVVGIFKKSIWL